MPISSAHRSSSSAWAFVESLNAAHLQFDQRLLKSVPYFGLSMDESTTVDSTQYLSLECCFWVPRVGKKNIFLELRAVEETDAPSILAAIVSAIHSFGFADVPRRLVGLASDGASVFTGQHNGVFVRASRSIAPFAMSTHCPAHRVNLCAASISSTVLTTLEHLSTSLNHHFNKSSKRQLAYAAIQEKLGLPSHKLLYGCETRWLSEVASFERIYEQYSGLITYAHNVIEQERLPDLVFTATSLCNVELCLQLPLVLRILGELNALVKVLQLEKLYLVQVAESVNTTISMLNKHFILGSKYTDSRYFADFNLLATSSESPLQWDDDDLVYKVDDDKFLMEVVVQGPGRPSTVKVTTMGQYQRIVKSAKDAMTVLAKTVVDSLSARFPATLSLEALAIIQLEYWKDPKLHRGVYDKAVEHLAEMYGLPRTITVDGKDEVVPALIDAQKLSYQSSFYWDYMLSAKTDLQTTDQLWLMCDADVALASRITEFHKVAHMVLSMPAHSVNNERAFSCMSLLKDAVRNRLGPAHLNCVMRLARSRFSLDNFPYTEAYQHWTDARDRYML